MCNLKRHLVANHKSEYEREVAENTENAVEEKIIKFSVTMGKNEAKNACIDLVTAEKLPLAVLDSKGFKTLTAQIFSGLDMPAVTSREESLLGSNVVICSIYLDPRIRRILLQTPTSLMLARAQLKQLLQQIFNLKEIVSKFILALTHTLNCINISG